MEYKNFQLQELFELWKTGFINLFFGDETHVCTSGYSPYGWQFPHEEVFVPCANKYRLNIFGMISPVCQYAGFECEESITGEKLAHFLEEFSKGITKPTVIVLDNASIHRRGFVAKEKKKWEEKGLYIFYLPPYSPHLNLAETVWRMLKGQWLQPYHYCDKTLLHESTRKILSEIGKLYKINFSCAA